MTIGENRCLYVNLFVCGASDRKFTRIYFGRDPVDYDALSSPRTVYSMRYSLSICRSAERKTGCRSAERKTGSKKITNLNYMTQLLELCAVHAVDVLLSGKVT